MLKANADVAKGVEGAAAAEAVALKGVRDAEADVAKASKDAAAASLDSRRGLSSVAAAMSEGIKVAGIFGAATIAAVGTFAAASVHAATDFQHSMETIHTQAGATQQEVAKMSQAVLELAPKVGTGPDELATALYHLESAGFRGQQAMDALKIAVEGAKVGNANLEDVTNALDATLVAGLPEAKNMGLAMGELNAIVGAGDMKMQDMADAMHSGIIASAKVFGLSLKDIGAALALFGDNNIRGSDAATKLRMAISLLGAPSKAAAGALSQIGLKSTELADDMRSPGGLVSAMSDLKKHLETSGKSATQQAAVLSGAFGGGRTSSAIMILLDQLDRLKTKYDDIDKGGKRFGQDWIATTKTAVFQTQSMHAAFSAIETAIGSALLPVVQKLLSSVLTFIGPLTQWIVLHKEATVRIMGVAAAIGALLVGLALANTAFHIVADSIKAAHMALKAFADNPWMLLLMAIVMIAILIATHWTETKEIFHRALHDMTAWALDAWHAIESGVMTAFNHVMSFIRSWGTVFLGALGGPITLGIALFVKFHDQIIAILEHLGSDLFNLGKSMVQHLISGITSMAGAVGNAVSGMVSHIPLVGGLLSHIPGLAEGGIVSSPTLAVIGEDGPEAVVPLGHAFGGAPGLGSSVYMDFRGAHFITDRDIDALTDKIGTRLATSILPRAGVFVQR